MTALEATPVSARSAIEALWNLDLAFADVVTTTSEPGLGAIRMAWWRERLEELDQGRQSAEPRIRAAKVEIVDRGISGSELSKLEDCWLPLLNPFPWNEAAAVSLKLRGRLLFGIGARLLGGDASEAEPAGALWSLVDGANHCSDPASRDYLLASAKDVIGEIPKRVPAEIRPLTILAALAAHDLRAGSRLGRVGTAFLHRLRGTTRKP